MRVERYEIELEGKRIRLQIHLSANAGKGDKAGRDVHIWWLRRSERVRLSIEHSTVVPENGNDFLRLVGFVRCAVCLKADVDCVAAKYILVDTIANLTRQL